MEYTTELLRLKWVALSNGEQRPVLLRAFGPQEQYMHEYPAVLQVEGIEENILEGYILPGSSTRSMQFVEPYDKSEAAFVTFEFTTGHSRALEGRYYPEDIARQISGLKQKLALNKSADRSRQISIVLDSAQRSYVEFSAEVIADSLSITGLLR